MIGNLPSRPSGSSPEAKFQQWVWDNISGHLQVNEVAGQRVNRTTRGTYVLPAKAKAATTEAAGSDVRIFNWANNDDFAALILGDMGTGSFVGVTPNDFQGKDIGSLVPGWSSAVEANIVSALASGKRIKTSIIFTVATESGAINTQSQPSCGFILYTGGVQYVLSFSAMYVATSEPNGLDCYFKCSFQGELLQAASGDNITHSEASKVEACMVADQLATSPVVYYSFMQARLLDLDAAVPNLTDGKITGYSGSVSNCAYEVGLLSLTIDALPAIAAA